MVIFLGGLGGALTFLIKCLQGSNVYYGDLSRAISGAWVLAELNCMPSDLPVRLPACRSARAPACLPICPCACLPAPCLAASQLACLP
jgi:hypothetical protein